MNDAKVSAGSPGELTPPGGPPGVPPAEGGAESSPEPYTICVRALSGEATTLKEAVRQCAAEAEARRQAGAEDEARRRAEIARDVAQLGPAQLKAKYDTEEGREALTMNDAKVSAGSPGELTPPGGPPGAPTAEGGAESPEAYTICVRALSGEATTLEEAVRQCAAEAEARRQAGAEDEARRRAEIARDVAQLGPAQLKAKYDTEEGREALTMSKAKVSAGSSGELTPPGGPPLEVVGADTIATVKKKFDAALVASDQEPMK